MMWTSSHIIQLWYKYIHWTEGRTKRTGTGGRHRVLRRRDWGGRMDGTHGHRSTWTDRTHGHHWTCMDRSSGPDSTNDPTHPIGAIPSDPHRPWIKCRFHDWPWPVGSLILSDPEWPRVRSRVTQDHLDAKMEANRMLPRRLLRRIRVERPLRDRQNPLLAWTEEETYSYLRFGPEVVMYITRLLSPRLERPTRRSRALPALLQVILALHLLASGSFLNVVRRLVGALMTPHTTRQQVDVETPTSLRTTFKNDPKCNQIQWLSLSLTRLHNTIITNGSTRAKCLFILPSHPCTGFTHLNKLPS